MARFDVYSNPDEPGYLLDCQADLLSELNTRLVMPLMPPSSAPVSGARSNPCFTIEGNRYVMATRYASAIPLGVLGLPVASLKGEDFTIADAWDILLTGI